MEIKQCYRAGERNIYNRPTFSGFISDLTEIATRYVSEKMSDILTETSEVFYLTSSAVLALLEKEGRRITYESDFYPLDVEITESELAGLMRMKSLVQTSPEDISEILVRLLDCHLETISKRMREVKDAHPKEEVILFFSPADTIDYTNTPAQEVYAFISDRGTEGIWLETESSFLIVPKGVESKVYRGGQD